MKTQLTLAQLASEVNRQRAAKEDFGVAANAAAATVEDGIVKLTFGGRSYPINNWAHRQVGEFLKIPPKYYDRMRAEDPQLLATNINGWLQKSEERRTVRVLDGYVRAFLGENFPLDRENYEFATTVLRELSRLDVQVHSAAITEQRLYIKVVHNTIRKDIPKGGHLGDGSHTIVDTIAPAMVASNSEVGSGALSLETGVWTKFCTNLAVFKERSVRKYHIGGKRKLEGSESVTRFLSDRTKTLRQEADLAEVADVLRGAFDQANFDAFADQLAGKAQNRITGKIEKVIELTAERFNLNAAQQDDVLKHLIEGGDLSQWGLSSALTRTAADQEDYEAATSLERAGGDLLEIKDAEWTELAKAA